jgi:hypothetical protein
MISVALFGIALIAIMTVLTQRVAGTLSAASNDREYEDAMYAAEAGLDVGLSQLAVDPAFSTITTGIDLSSREAVILAAEQLAADPEQVVSTPSGDYVIVKRSDSDTVYAVGAAPSWTDGNRRVRVVEGTVEPLESEVCWPEGALIANGLLEWGGGAVMTVPSSAHAAHAIGNGSFKGSRGSSSTVTSEWPGRYSTLRSRTSTERWKLGPTPSTSPPAPPWRRGRANWRWKR